MRIFFCSMKINVIFLDFYVKFSRSKWYYPPSKLPQKLPPITITTTRKRPLLKTRYFTRREQLTAWRRCLQRWGRLGARWPSCTPSAESCSPSPPVSSLSSTASLQDTPTSSRTSSLMCSGTSGQG